MELTFRWYGPNEEKVTLEQIRQIFTGEVTGWSAVK